VFSTHGHELVSSSVSHRSIDVETLKTYLGIDTTKTYPEGRKQKAEVTTPEDLKRLRQVPPRKGTGPGGMPPGGYEGGEFE